MKRVSADFHCPCCKHKNVMRFQKPTFMSVTRFGLDCAACGAKYKMAIRRKRGSPQEITFETQMVTLPTKLPKAEALRLYHQSSALQALTKPREGAAV